MWWESVRTFIQSGSSVAGIIAVFWALWVYHNNSRRERARWTESLYARFYERTELKAVREMLDCKSGSAEVSSLVAEEPAALTDYLNFFEFMAYLEKSRQLSKADMKALFDYYLKCLSRHKELSAYIQDPQDGFENLRRILSDA
jgi:hypothetical protein